MPRSHSGLTQKKITVRRKGKTFQRTAWTRTKDFVKQHKGKIIAGTVAVAAVAGGVALHRRGKRLYGPYMGAKGTTENFGKPSFHQKISATMENRRRANVSGDQNARSLSKRIRQRFNSGGTIRLPAPNGGYHAAKGQQTFLGKASATVRGHIADLNARIRYKSDTANMLNSGRNAKNAQNHGGISRLPAESEDTRMLRQFNEARSYRGTSAHNAASGTKRRKTRKS